MHGRPARVWRSREPAARMPPAPLSRTTPRSSIPTEGYVPRRLGPADCPSRCRGDVTHEPSVPSQPWVYNDDVPDIPAGAEWSPADHPYAIAVSEATWWRCAVQLAVARLGDPEDRRAAPFSSRQVDARNLVFALVQLLAAERLEQAALGELGVDSAISEALSDALDRYLAALPDIQKIRNALTHFDDWAIGHGRGPQTKGFASGAERRDVAGTCWGFGYYASEQLVRLGPFEISVPTAMQAAVELARAIEAAAMNVDGHSR
jgi:hypothetical protein